MHETAADWQFPASDGGMYEGFNDAGIETFTEKPMEKEGREAIQNALDPVKDKTKPVRVEIHVSALPSHQIPGARTLARTFGKCRETIEQMAAMNQEEEDKQALEFYQFAQSRLALHMPLWMIRISDYNTTGLIGAADGRFGSTWYKLIKARGLNNKRGGAGGSFGIGKMASFGCSKLRTVFYGTRVDGKDSYIGVTRLQSYARGWQGDRPILTSGTGYYAQGDDMLAIPGPCPLRDTPRTEDGTDLYILDARGRREDILESFRRAVLQNFFITIYEGNLVVKLTDEQGTAIILDKNTLGREINALVEHARTKDEQEEMQELWDYYDILRHETADDPDNYLEFLLDRKVFGAAYGFRSGECRLLLKKGENLNRRILITRRTGMTIFPMKNFPGGLSFTGILRITGDNMNELYRKMEVPSHDKWDPERCTDGKADYAGALRDLRAYLTQIVRENCQPAAAAAVSAYGMEEFFLTNRTTIEEKGVKTVAGNPHEKKPHIRAKKQNPTTRRHADPIPGDTPSPAPKTDDPKKPRTPGPRHEHHKEYRSRAVVMHLLPQNPYKGIYRLTFTVPYAKRGAKVELLGSPERPMKNCGLDVAAARCDGHTVTVCDNEIYLDAVEKNEAIAIDFTLALPGLFMMEANYYEAK